MDEQGAFTRSFVMVEIFTTGLTETFHRAPAAPHVLHDVRCVRAAVAGIGEALLANLRCHHDDNSQLD